MKTAFITGITGQDGSYLAEHLLQKGYRVGGTARSGSSLLNLQGMIGQLEIIGMDMRVATDVEKAIIHFNPDEIYNLAGQTFQPTSWLLPEYTLDVNATGLLRILEAIKKTGRNIKVFHASAAGMFGKVDGACNEDTPLAPVTPYDIAKVAAHQLCTAYRDQGMFVCAGILFAHESPRRGYEFISRKISLAVANWAVGNVHYPLVVGDLSGKRDSGWAPDYVEAMHAMLQVDVPMDYVIGTGQLYSIQEFFDAAIQIAKLKLEIYSKRAEASADLKRSHHFASWASCARASAMFGYNPAKTNFYNMVERMIHAEIRKLKGA